MNQIHIYGRVSDKMKSKRGEEERLARFEHKQQTREYNKLQQSCQFYHNKKKQTENENANYLSVCWNSLFKVMMMVFWRWCGPVSRTLSSSPCHGVRGRAMLCSGQAGPGTNHGPGHSLESDQQTAQAVRSAGGYNAGKTSSNMSSIRQPAVIIRVSCALCHRSGDRRLPVTQRVVWGHELIELRNRDNQRSCFTWCPCCRGEGRIFDVHSCVSHVLTMSVSE